MTQAKEANSIWYFLAQTASSINEDENINIRYSMDTKFVMPYGAGPYPVMRIKITNKSHKIMYVDLGTSYLKRNGVASAIYVPKTTATTSSQSVGIGVNAGAIADAAGIGGIVGTALNGVNVGGSKGSSVTTTTMTQRIVSVPPHSSMVVEDVIVIQPGYEQAFNGLFYFKKLAKRLWCCSRKFNGLKSGRIMEFDETNTPCNIGCYLNYSFSEKFETSTGIETDYYVNKMVGSHRGTKMTSRPVQDVKIVNKTFPNWKSEVDNGKLMYMRLWTNYVM